MDYFRIFVIDKYLNRKYSCALERINKNNIIKTIDESNFWSLNICKLNNTQTFINRRFNYLDLSLNKDIYNIIKSEIKNIIKTKMLI